ncbi:MAG: hypothetical protein MRJ96_07785 [Nitrospirales bacterium]|nr:hypothetical protein [Nitrospira sp.]MDR4501334.1 hypothetical protein [Nitrospirales bacterium]
MSDQLREKLSDIGTQMEQFHLLLNERAREIEVTGGDPDIVTKLVNGADAMKDSANIYLSWARHFVGLSEGGASEAEEGEEDSADFQF